MNMHIPCILLHHGSKCIGFFKSLKASIISSLTYAPESTGGIARSRARGDGALLNVIPAGQT